MNNKVILISIDGMRPDGLTACGNPYVEELLQKGSYTLNAQTVFPSVTLPCHLSMFHSVTPQRHGTTTNAYMPQVRPIDGLFEQTARMGSRNASFYNWEPMRDLGRPGSVQAVGYMDAYAAERVDAIIVDKVLEYIPVGAPDFVFVHLAETDMKGGHDAGWMSETYFDTISRAIDGVKKIVDAHGEEYTVIITADHGGQDRIHGTDLPEDMTVPMIFLGKAFAAGKVLENVSILDIAPTIATLMGVSIPREWEGKSLI